MRFVIALVMGLLFGVLTNSAEARGRRSVSVSQTVSVTAAPGETATAQGVANIMARLGRVGHFGGNRGYEGCGMAGSPAAAYAICCFANDPTLVTIDVGYAQRGGMFFCCRRYSRR